MDFYSMDLKEIEKELKIQPYKGTKGVDKVICDDWEDVQNFLKDKKDRERFSPYYDFTCHGYELTHDNHYIAVYYNSRSLNS